MNLPLPTLSATPLPGGFELRFESLFHPGRALVFPCDERGCVVLDSLSEPARRNYFYARAVVGREFATPAVVRGQQPAGNSAAGNSAAGNSAAH